MLSSSLCGKCWSVDTTLIEPEREGREVTRQLLPELPPYIEHELLKLQSDTNSTRSPFTASEKATVCRVYARTGSLVKAAEAIHVSPTTVYRHMELDEAFRSAFALSKHSLCDRIQSKSVERALTDNGVVDRMCQLKRFAPQVYRENQSQVAVGVSIQIQPWVWSFLCTHSIPLVR